MRRLIAAGASAPTAIREALGMPVTQFARRYRLPRGTTSDALNATRRATDAQIAALVAELGGTEAEWRDLLWQAARPGATSPAPDTTPAGPPGRRRRAAS